MMTTPDAGAVPAALRARIAADLAAVRPLPSPAWRAAWLTPFALLLLAAAPVAFELRPGAERLGWIGTWGLSIVQAAAALAVVWAGLRDAVPGRSWSPAAAAALFVAPLGLMALITLASWVGNPVGLAAWWTVGGLCLAGSAASAMPAVALASVLAARAYPVHPVRTGALVGLGGGLMADAGWRLFCHFSAPGHVLTAHVAGVAVATIGGIVLTRRLAQQRNLRS
ncbi:MAG: NrsF family protein [Vicinamibacterales bacterium]